LFPNLQSRDDDPYEEGVLDLRFGWIHHRLEFNIIIQLMIRCCQHCLLKVVRDMRRKGEGQSIAFAVSLRYSCSLVGVFCTSKLWGSQDRANPVDDQVLPALLAKGSEGHEKKR
jgi:hypothetical protein